MKLLKHFCKLMQHHGIYFYINATEIRRQKSVSAWYTMKVLNLYTTQLYNVFVWFNQGRIGIQMVITRKHTYCIVYSVLGTYALINMLIIEVER